MRKGFSSRGDAPLKPHKGSPFCSTPDGLLRVSELGRSTLSVQLLDPEFVLQRVHQLFQLLPPSIQVDNPTLQILSVGIHIYSVVIWNYGVMVRQDVRKT
jgi:hypothetical protein